MPYENFNLSEWPFRTSADEKFAAVWAGRTETKQQIERLLKKIELIPRSALHIFWANFGMGKTHTLYHLKFLCSSTHGRIIPIYAVMPKRSSGFLELYREIVQGFLTAELRDYLGQQLMEIGQSQKGSNVALHPIFSKAPGVVRALLAIRNGDLEETTAAMQWITAQPGLPASTMRRIAVTYRIKTPEDCINALSALINLALWGGNPQKQILLMIDEFQQIEELKPSIISQINSGLHTMFNAHPQGLQLLLTFSFGKRENVEYLLSPELKSRAELQSINLDVLARDEAVEFLTDLLTQFRINKDAPRSVYPFTQTGVETMLTRISAKKSLTPRRIMLYADHVLAAHLENTNGSNKEITDEEVRSYLSLAQLGELDVDADSSHT